MSLSARHRPVVWHFKDGTLPCGLMARYSADLKPPSSAGDTTEHSDSGMPFSYKMIRARPPLLDTGMSNRKWFDEGKESEDVIVKVEVERLDEPLRRATITVKYSSLVETIMV